MDLIEKFAIITKEYDDSLFEILKDVIDEAKMHSQKSNLVQ